MYDGNKIIIGLVIFVALVTMPFWSSKISGAKGSKGRPVLEYPTDPAKKQCVESKEYMAAYHMDLLDKWRDEAIREGRRMYISTTYKTKHEMSLSRTCMSCHTSKEKFCDRCHDYSVVKPYCWDCHVTPEIAKGGN